MKDAAAAFAIAACALLIASRFPLGREWSDTFFLVRDVKNGASPYYNFAYLPLGIALDRSLGDAATTMRSLEWLSAGALAATLALAHRMLRASGVGSLLAALACLSIGLAPGVAFHATAVEVHGVALAGATAALFLALRARELPRNRANRWLLASVVTALLFHLSHVFLVPGLCWIAFARGRATGAGLSRRGWFAVFVVAALIAMLGLWLSRVGPETWVAYPGLRPLGTLADFTRELGGARARAGWYTPLEQADYLKRELALPLGILALAPLAVALRWRRMSEARRAVAVDLVPAVLVPSLILSQTGVHEHGGYFLFCSVAAAFAAALSIEGSGTKALLAASAPLLLLQGALTAQDRVRFLDREDPVAFTQRIAPALGEGDRVLVDSLAKWFRLSTLRRDTAVWDLRRELETTPGRGRDDVLVRAVAKRLHGPEGTSLWIDRALLYGAPHGAWQTKLQEVLADERVEHVPAIEGFERLRLVDAR